MKCKARHTIKVHFLFSERIIDRYNRANLSGLSDELPGNTAVLKTTKYDDLNICSFNHNILPRKSKPILLLNGLLGILGICAGMKTDTMVDIVK